MKSTYILAIDQGTTSSRAIVFNQEAKLMGMGQKEFTQYFPKPGWVEHDPKEIWETTLFSIKQAIKKAGIQAKDLSCIGITNQRETALIWDKRTGEPIYNAIVWQSRQTEEICSELKAGMKESLIREKTGLLIDPYFSGTKFKWILDNLNGLNDLNNNVSKERSKEQARAQKEVQTRAQTRVQKENLCAGTIDSWLIWKLTKGRVHATDVTNASRTLLFNIHTLSWDDELCDVLGVPKAILPEVKESSSDFGITDRDVIGAEVPIGGVAGDQHASLFGQGCFNQGEAKNTYGTGCFLLMNTGSKPVRSSNGLLTTIAWSINGQVEYALEGSIYIAGSAIQWLRDGLKILKSSKDSQTFAQALPSNEGVYLVPSFVGLGAPYWESHCRGAVYGLTRGSTHRHFCRAALEAIAYQTKDVLLAMEEDNGEKLSTLRVDGGATTNDFLMQFQSDLLDVKVCVASTLETTALGAAFLAGLSTNIWSNLKEIKSLLDEKSNIYRPKAPKEEMKGFYKDWKKAVATTINFSKS